MEDDIIEDGTTAMGKHEAAHVLQLLIGSHISGIIDILADGVECLSHISPTPDEWGIPGSSISAHAACLLDHLAVAVLANTNVLRHDKTAIDGSFSLCDSRGEVFESLKACLCLVVIIKGCLPLNRKVALVESDLHQGR